MNLNLIYKVQTIDNVFSKSSNENVRRTLIFNIFFILPIFGNVLGTSLIIAGVDDSRIFVDRFLYPSIALGHFFFNCATLSISTIWDNMARKIIPLPSESSRQRRKLISWAFFNRVPASRHHCCTMVHRRCAIYLVQCVQCNTHTAGAFALSLFALSVVIMGLFFSPFNVTLVISAGCLVVGASYTIAGNRMAHLLSIGAGIQPSKCAKFCLKKGIKIVRTSNDDHARRNIESADIRNEKNTIQSKRATYSRGGFWRKRKKRLSNFGGSRGMAEANVVFGSTSNILNSRKSPHESEEILSIGKGHLLTTIPDVEYSSKNSEEGDQSSLKQSKIKRSFFRQMWVRMKRSNRSIGVKPEPVSEESTEASLLRVAAQIRSMAHFIAW